MTRVRVAIVLGVALAGPAFAAAVESYTSPLPAPSEGKAVVQVICRQTAAGLMSDCRGLRALPLGIPVFRDAEAKVNGTTQPIGPTPGSALQTVEIDLPAGPAPARNPESIDWASKPTAAQAKAVYPPRALGDHIGGSAVLSCRVTPMGAAYSCLVVSEFPKGEGFGQAALRLANLFKLRRTDNGASGTLVVPVGFAP